MSGESRSGIDDYVTVVSVEPERTRPPGYVTVLRIGEATETLTDEVVEEVCVYRLPGERLGFGLKFEGGTKAAEPVERLFIQSCAPDSPASAASCSWGRLVQGDEVLTVDTLPVSRMTRIECVRRLKDSDVVVRLVVRHVPRKATEDVPQVVGAEKKRAPPPPPPVPPRKIPRRARPDDPNATTRPRRPRRDRRPSDPESPPDAEIYSDLLAHETACNLSESDDTDSTVSTVVDRHSGAGSVPSTPTSAQRRVGDPGESEPEPCEEPPRPPANFRDAPLSYGTEKVRGVAQHTAPVRPDEELQLPLTTEDLLQSSEDPSVPFDDFLEACRSRSRSSPQLATIGEVDEEGCLDVPCVLPAPVLVVENADPEDRSDLSYCDREKLDLAFGDLLQNENTCKIPIENKLPKQIENEKNEEHQVQQISYPSKTETLKNSVLTGKHYFKSNRISALFRDQQSSCSFQDKIAFFSNSQPTFTVTNPVSLKNFENCNRWTKMNKKTNYDCNSDNNINSVDSTTINNISKDYNVRDINKTNLNNELYGIACLRSNGNISEVTAPKRISSSFPNLSFDAYNTENLRRERWNLLMEQRQKSLSKLKGLVILDRDVPVDSSDVVDLPEIKSGGVPITGDIHKLRDAYRSIHQSRSTLQSQSQVDKILRQDKNKSISSLDLTKNDKFENEVGSNLVEKCFSLTSLDINKSPSDAPSICGDPTKSLESLSSLTHSDCSYDYVNGATEGKFCSKTISKKIEEESDNDSAISSSQSSYSRVSPPMSPKSSPTSNGICGSPSMIIARLSSKLHNESQSNIVTTKLDFTENETRYFNKEYIYEKPEKQCDSVSCNIKGAILNENAFNDIEVDKSFKTDTVEDKQLSSLNGEKEQKDTLVPLSSSKNFVQKEESKLLKKYPPIETPKNNRKSYLSKALSSQSSSVTDLRKSFEKLAPTNTSLSKIVFPNFYINNIKKPEETCANVKSKTRLSQAPQKKREPVKEESVQDEEEIKEVVLHPLIPGGSVGITLAGGSDYENKEVTVYKIRENSSAHKDGRLKKGDVVTSINNQNVEGLTHRKLVAILKEPLPEVTLTIYRKKINNKFVQQPKVKMPSTTPEKLPTNTTQKISSEEIKTKLVVLLIKDSTGLGLSLEGGQDSPLENVPLQIKKIFKGGVADKCEKLNVGDRLMLINDIDVTTMSRFQAWSVLKKIPEGSSISLTIQR